MGEVVRCRVGADCSEVTGARDGFPSVRYQSIGPYCFCHLAEMIPEGLHPRSPDSKEAQVAQIRG
jgi:hypothetical protein